MNIFDDKLKIDTNASPMEGISFEIKNHKFMKRFQKIMLVAIVFMVCFTLRSNAQMRQIDFKYEKIVKDSIKIELKVSVLEGDGPYKYIIYQGDPMDKGIAILEEETILKNFSIILEKKSNLFLYIASEGIVKPKSFKIASLD